MILRLTPAPSADAATAVSGNAGFTSETAIPLISGTDILAFGRSVSCPRMKIDKMKINASCEGTYFSIASIILHPLSSGHFHKQCVRRDLSVYVDIEVLTQFVYRFDPASQVVITRVYCQA